MNFMYPDRLKKNTDATSESVVPSAVEGATTATKSASNTQTTTQAATTAANANGSVESQYKIKVDDIWKTAEGRGFR